MPTMKEGKLLATIDNFMSDFIKEHKEVFYDIVAQYIDEHRDEIRAKLYDEDRHDRAQSDDCISLQQYNQLQHQLNKAAEENNNLKEQLEGLTNAKHEADDKIAELNKKLAESEANSKKLRGDKEKLRAGLETAESNLKAAEADKINVDTQLRAVKADRETIEQQKNTLQQDLHEAKQTIERYQQNYAEAESAYRLYQSFDDSTKNALINIFNKPASVLDFLCSAAQKDHLDDIWEYFKYRFNNDDLDDGQSRKFNKLFDFCFELVNKSEREPVYTRLESCYGRNFDSDSMIKTSDSRQLGTVRKEFLLGYKYSKGSIVNKTLVKL